MNTADDKQTDEPIHQRNEVLDVGRERSTLAAMEDQQEAFSADRPIKAAPTLQQAAGVKEASQAFRVARMWLEQLAPSRHKSMAITHLEDAFLRFNQALSKKEVF